jgi:carboxylesterase type B
MKASQGLFQRAIMESNPLGLPMMPLSEAQDFGDKLSKALKCSNGDDLTCLRAASAAVRVCAFIPFLVC